MECRGAALRPRPGAPPSSPRAPCRASCRVCKALVGNTLRGGPARRGVHSTWTPMAGGPATRTERPPWIVFSTLPRPRGPAASPCGSKPGPRVAAGELSSSSGFRGLGTLSCRHKSPLKKKRDWSCRRKSPEKKIARLSAFARGHAIHATKEILHVLGTLQHHGHATEHQPC